MKYNYWHGCGNKGKPHTLLVGMLIGVAMESSMMNPPNVKKRTIMWSSNLPSGYISKEIEIRISKRYLHSHIHRSIIHNGQDMEVT